MRISTLTRKVYFWLTTDEALAAHTAALVPEALEDAPEDPQGSLAMWLKEAVLEAIPAEHSLVHSLAYEAAWAADYGQIAHWLLRSHQGGAAEAAAGAARHTSV